MILNICNMCKTNQNFVASIILLANEILFTSTENTFCAWFYARRQQSKSVHLEFIRAFYNKKNNYSTDLSKDCRSSL